MIIGNALFITISHFKFEFKNQSKNIVVNIMLSGYTILQSYIQKISNRILHT